MATFSSGDDKKSAVLQVADAVVYEIRRALHISSGQWKEALRRQIRTLQNAGALYLLQECLKEFAAHCRHT
jgi:hypothetical protein